MSAIPLLLQFPQTPGSPSPLHRPISRTPNALRQGFNNTNNNTTKANNRKSFPPDHNQEHRWSSLLSRAAPSKKPYGACGNPAPLHGGGGVEGGGGGGGLINSTTGNNGQRQVNQQQQQQQQQQQHIINPAKTLPSPPSLTPSITTKATTALQALITTASQKTSSTTTTTTYQPPATTDVHLNNNNNNNYHQSNHPYRRNNSRQPPPAKSPTISHTSPTPHYTPLVPTASFNGSVTSPTAIKLFPNKRLNKSQSHLIMPRMKSFLRAGQGSSSSSSASSSSSTTSRSQPHFKDNNNKKDNTSTNPRGNDDDRLSRDVSVRSLASYGDVSSPAPLIRKCHTMLALSTTGTGVGSFVGSVGGSSSTTAHTRVVRERKTSKLGFLRRISSSRSAVFTANRMMIAIPKSPSVASDMRRLKHNSSSFLFTQAEMEGEAGSGGCSRCTSAASIASRRFSGLAQDGVFCKLCLTDVSIREMYQLQQCQCRFCKYCMGVYVTLKIREGDYVIECPDANCDCSGELTLEEIESLVGSELLQLHMRFRRNTEVDLDPVRAWCPMAECDTVINLPSSKLEGPQCTTCTTCTTVFCAACSEPWHPSQPCHAGSSENMGVPNDDMIKRCPSCNVPIERDAGCAQMLCKKCKHVFCWYCLASLDDDFLLRHYDKGPCKNKLGHSRASVLWHRAQVIGIFAGFGLLLVVASPLLLFVGPCLLCCKCKPCAKHEIEEESLYGI